MVQISTNLEQVGLNDDESSPVPDSKSTKSDTTSVASSKADKVTVAEVEKWCRREFFRMEEADWQWYQRLGDTYYSKDERALAVSSYRKSIELNNQSPPVYERLAYCILNDSNDPEDIQLAVVEMKKAAELAEKEESRNEERLANAYIRLSEWYHRLDQKQPAIEYTNKVLELNSSDVEIQFRILKNCLLHNYLEGYAKHWNHIAKDPNNQYKRGLLTEILQKLVYDDESNELILKWLSFIHGNVDSLLFLLQEMKAAIDGAQEEEQTYGTAGLLLYEGIARRFQGNNVFVGSALDSWTRCLGEYTVYTRDWPRAQAVWFISAYHFDQTRTEMNSLHRGRHVQAMRALVEKETPFVIGGAKIYLASFYTADKASSEARNVLQGSIRSALDMLSDAEIENDFEAYGRLGMALTHCDDDVNVVAAFSNLLGEPPESSALEWILDFDSNPARDASRDLQEAVKEELSETTELSEKLNLALQHVERLLSLASNGDDTTNTGATHGLEEVRERLNLAVGAVDRLSDSHRCDGFCSRPWNHENAIYLCRYCYDTAFCEECLGRLKRGERIFTFGGFLCNRNHDWLCLPKREKREWLECLKGNVRVGGRFEGGVHVDSELVPVSQWLDTLKREWGWEGSTEVVKEGEKRDDEADVQG